MTQEEIKKWIDRWSKLKPSPRRDMTIEIWSKALGTCTMGKETLEEAAEKYRKHWVNNTNSTISDTFMAGAKWQSERIPSIIEEYLETAFITGIHESTKMV